MDIFRTKSVEQSIRDTEDPEHQLRKRLTATDLTVFGIGVIVGEYGAYAKAGFPGSQPYVRDWARYVTGAIRRNGLVPLWWDTGSLVDRRTGALKDPELVEAIVGAPG